MKAYNSGFQYIHRYGQPSPQPITEHFHRLKKKPCALFSQPLTSLNPLAQGEREPSFCLGSGTRWASLERGPTLGLSGVRWAGAPAPEPLQQGTQPRRPARPGKTRPEALGAPGPRRSTHPQGGGGRRNRPRLTSARAQNAASAMGSWRGWRKAASLLFLGRQPPEPGERSPRLRAAALWRGPPPC